MPAEQISTEIGTIPAAALSRARHLPAHTSPEPDLLDATAFPRRTQDREKLISDRRSQCVVGSLKTLCGDHPCRNVVSGDKTRRISEHVHTEPCQLVTGEVAGTLGIGASRFD